MNTKSSGWFKVLYILMAILYILAGITFMADPFGGQYTLVMVFASICLVYGIMMIVSYFMSVHYKSVWALVLGFVMIVVGIVCFMNPTNSAQFIGICAGIGFLVAGAYKTFQSFKLKDFGLSTWWAVLISGICSLVIGCLMLFNIHEAGALFAMYIGVDLLVTGISDLVLGFMLI